MRFNLRWLSTAASITVLVAACGSSPATSGPGSTAPAGGTQGPAATDTPVSGLEGLGTELLAPVFGGAVPTPECDTRSDGSSFCRWTSADGATVLDAEHSSEYATVDEWRTAFGTAGFDEELPGIGVAALGGENPLSDGFRAAAYTAGGESFTVSLSKTGDATALKALVTAILAALAS